MNDINIYLIRHGESYANTNAPDTIGQDNDTPLTEHGIDQARALGRRFATLDRPIFIASSSYLRALNTTKVACVHAGWSMEDVDITDALVEYNPGNWKGKKRADLYKDQASLNKINYLNMGFLFPGGESYFRCERRAATYIEDNVIYNERILAEAEKRDVNVMVFSHGMTIRCLLRYVAGFDTSFMWKLTIDNTSVSHLRYNDKGWFLNSINDTAHLK